MKKLTNITPYCQIGPYDISSNVYAEGVSPSGGGFGVEEIVAPHRNYADIRMKGRQPKRYKIRASGKTREDIETFLEICNTAEEDDEFYPFDNERFGLIASAHAGMESTKRWGGLYNFYTATAEITCREPWLYGPAQGMDFAYDVAVPAVSATLTNNGHEPAPIRYLQASGDYVSSSYVEDLSIRITPGSSTIEHDRELVLCEKLMRGDLFQLGWRGEVEHSYESQMTADLFYDLITHMGGSYTISGGTLSMVGGAETAYFWMPFHGPLSLAGDPGSAKLELWVSAVAGSPAVFAITDFVNYTPVVIDTDDIVVGYNDIYIPGYAGYGSLGFGVWCPTAGDSITLSKFKGTVKRYVASSQIPAADPLEEFKIRVESTAGTQLSFLEVEYNDIYYY